MAEQSVNKIEKSVKSDFVPIQVKVPKELKMRFKTYCVTHDTNMSETIIKAMENIMKE